jgi:hypothetical protein
MIATICSSENDLSALLPPNREPVSQLIDGPKISGQVSGLIETTALHRDSPAFRLALQKCTALDPEHKH